MSKLCLSTYLSVLKIYENPQESGLRKILNALVNSICTTQQVIPDFEVSKIKNGKKDISRYVMDSINENIDNPLYQENAKRELYHLLNPNKLTDIAKVLATIIIEDPDIKEDITIDSISHTKKNDLAHIQNEFDFIIGVFPYIIQRTKNVHTEAFAAEITQEFCSKAIKKYNTTYSISSKDSIFHGIIMDSDLPSQAKAFCRTYEDSKALLPLCQIANIVNPTHNHVNVMYSAYCDCSNNLKKQIMQEIDCPMIHVNDKLALYKLLERFSSDIEALGLASTNKTYVFSQYVVETLEFEELELIEPAPSIFPLVPSSIIPWQKTSTLSRFIGDYLYYKDTENALPIPFDWMWNKFDLAGCDCKYLILWLNLFIINCCYQIDKPTDNMSEKNESPVIPNIRDAKTIEDLHFLALLLLYDTYMCK